MVALDRKNSTWLKNTHLLMMDLREGERKDHKPWATTTAEYLALIRESGGALGKSKLKMLLLL